MNWNELFSRDNEPTMEQVGEFINNPLWNRLNCILLDDFKVRAKFEYSGCSIPGWNLKYKKKGKNLCTIYPQAGYFKILVIGNERNQNELDFFIKTCCEYIQQIYNDTKFFNGGKWLIVDVNDQSTFDDVVGLIKIRSLE